MIRASRQLGQVDIIRGQPVEKKFCIGYQQKHESPEEYGVIYTETIAVGNSATLRERVIYCTPDTFGYLFEAIVRFSQSDQTKTIVTTPTEEGY